MSDAYVSGVTPCRSEQYKQSWVPAPGVGLALVTAPHGSKMLGAVRAASATRELKGSYFLPPTTSPFSSSCGKGLCCPLTLLHGSLCAGLPGQDNKVLTPVSALSLFSSFSDPLTSSVCISLGTSPSSKGSG